MIPDNTDDLLEALREAYPPRCMAVGETVEAHLRYAGASALVESLWAQWNEQQRPTRVD